MKAQKTVSTGNDDNADVKRYPDEQIEYWGNLYRECRLHLEGVTFEVFLEDPWGWLVRIGQAEAIKSLEQGFKPLLPAQARVARQLLVH